MLNVHYINEEDKHFVTACHYVEMGFSDESLTNDNYTLVVRVPNALICRNNDGRQTAKIPLRFVIGVCPSDFLPADFDF